MASEGRESLFGRNVKLYLGEREITGLRIDFKVQRRTKGEYPAATISIYNVSDDLYEDFAKRDKLIILEAGYGENIGPIITGVVARHSYGREKISRKLELLIDNALSKTMSNPIKIKVSPGTSAHLFLDELERQVRNPEVGIGNRNFRVDRSGLSGLSDRKSDQVGTHRYYGLTIRALSPYEGSVKGALNHFVEKLNHALNTTGSYYIFGGGPELERITISYFDDDGIIRFARNGVGNYSSSRLTISPQTGLIGSPKSEEEDGIQATVFLDHNIGIGSAVTLTGVGYSQKERREGRKYKVIECSHSGTNWVGNFHTTMHLRPIK